MCFIVRLEHLYLQVTLAVSISLDWLDPELQVV